MVHIETWIGHHEVWISTILNMFGILTNRLFSGTFIVSVFIPTYHYLKMIHFKSPQLHITHNYLIFCLEYFRYLNTNEIITQIQGLLALLQVHGRAIKSICSPVSVKYYPHSNAGSGSGLSN